MSHNCESLVLHCMDWRLKAGLIKWFQSGVVSSADCVSLAGSVKSLISPDFESDKDFLIRQISISKTLHNIKRIVLINHSDCGAYGGSSCFVNNQDEFNFHKQELQKAVEVLKGQFPDLQIETYIAVLAKACGGWKITMHKV